MPRRRRTNVGTRPKPQLPAGSEEVDMSEEEKKAKLAAFLQDFDVEVELKVAEMRKQCNQMCRDIQHAIRLESSKLSKEVKSMKLSEYFGANGASSADRVMEEITKTVDDMVSKSLPKEVLKCLTSGTESDNKSTEEESETDSSTSSLKPTRKRQKKKGKATTAKKTTSTKKATKCRSVKSENDENVAPSTSVRRSTRKRIQTTQDTPATQSNSRKGSFQTPADKIGISKLGTPFITPKFDPRAQLTPDMIRRAKKGEVLMSLAGSPVEPKLSLSPVDPKSVEEWVQDVQTKMVNVFPGDQRLDEVDRRNIAMLQETLSKMLKDNQVPSI